MGSPLFEPLKIGTVALQHRVVLAPFTRFKTNAAHIPGIWGPAQISAWREVRTAALNADADRNPMNLWALGRVAEPAQLAAIRAFPVPEIAEDVAIYAQAAGCDGVEVHAANGYLPDQFLQDVSNTRTDAYGGSIANRARFILKVVGAIVAAVGPERAAIRLSPWSTVHDMGMQDPLPTFSYLISELAARHPTLAYLHLIKPRISGDAPRAESTVGAHESNDALLALWAPRPLIRAGGFDRASALAAAEDGSLIVFGRLFISNPDLPTRLEKGAPLAPYDRRTFHLAGRGTRGYTDQGLASGDSRVEA